MNAEVIKAMNKKEKKHPIRKWWRNNSYKVWRVILFPVWIGSIVKEKVNTWLNSRNSWDVNRANEILNYYIPRRAEWGEEEKSFFFFDNGMGWSIHSAKRYLKRKDRRFWRVNASSWGYKFREHLMKDFELEGFEKEIGDCSCGWTDIIFKMIEE